MTQAPRKRAVKKPPETKIPPTTEDFKQQAHGMLEILLNEYPGTDSLVLIVDGLSGYEVASIPMSVSVKKGLFMSGYKILFGDEDDN